MMIDPRQIRAARALLNWSQPDLARAAGLATSSVKNVESECASARRETIQQIVEAFNGNGVEFIPGVGVRLKNDIVAVHADKFAAKALLDDIYVHVQIAPVRELCVIGLDEGFSVDMDGQQLITSHIDRLEKAGITQRILVREGESQFLGKADCYRWLPKQYFTHQSPIYVYGDRIATLTGSLRRRATIIESRQSAQHMRMLFELLWDTASSPVRAFSTSKP